MATNRKVVKVFLASPGDMEKERIAAKDIADELNTLWADEYGFQVELVGWEDTVSGVGRPQAIINEDLDKCEFFIGMMWKRWGTPPDKSGTFSSGFEEEFTRALESNDESGRPDISLYFKDVDKDALNDPGVELKKVQIFKEKIVEEKKLYYEKFSGEIDFRQKIRRCLTRYIQKLKTKEHGEEKLDSSPIIVEVNIEDSELDRGSQQHLLSNEGVEFLNGLIENNVRKDDDDRLSNVDVARLRLLAVAVGEPGNDDQVLGNHDANILYRSRNKLQLSRREINALVEAALDRIESQAAPLWYWLSVRDTEEGPTVKYDTIGTPVRVRSGAIKVMRLLSEKLPDEEPLDRKFFLRNWLGDKAQTNVKIAALGYLAEFGVNDDLQYINQELAKGAYQTGSAATEAGLLIRLRDSRHSAITYLLETQTTSISETLADEIFADVDIEDATLLSTGLEHRSVFVRRKVVDELAKRDCLTQTQISALFQDDDPLVRFKAMVCAFETGARLTEEEAKKLLIRPKGPFVSLAALGGRVTCSPSCPRS